MPDTKISAGADPVTVVATDKVPMARSASTTAYAATMTELAAFANTAYVPNYYTSTPSMDGSAFAGSVAFVSRGDHVHPSDTARVAKAGDTMGGFLTLNANPTANLHAATKQYVDGSAPVGGPYVAIANMHDVGRNLIHNPLFNVAQRGAGPWTANDAFTVDRWQIGVALDAVSFTQIAVSDAVRTAIGDEAAAFGLSNAFTGNAGATAISFIRQKIEGVRRLAGKTITLSFWAVGVTATKLGINIFQNFGTGGSPSAAVTVQATGTLITLASTWTKYTATFTIPSIVGKTLGANSDDSTGLHFYFSSGANTNAVSGNIGVQSGTIQLWGVQLEIGSVATPLEKPDPRYDLANCQRFYCVGRALLGGYALTGYVPGYFVTFPATMRALPAITTADGGAGNITGQTYNTVSTMGANFYGTVTATGTFQIFINYTASADL